MKKSLSLRNRVLINVGVILAVVATVAILIFATRSTNTPEATGEVPQAVRENSHRLSTAKDGKVTLVEFLDFECEACGAAYPFLEDLRQEYAGRVTFVVRYFPIPSHNNAENAALAAEAAARQGNFEGMYSKLFESQSEWGEQPDSRAEDFRLIAQELGLDMQQYDADIANPAVLERVMADQDEGVALGVQGTPTFFLNGEKLEVSTMDDFRSAIDKAIRK